MRSVSAFYSLLTAFFLFQLFFAPAPVMGRSPDPLILPPGNVQALLSADRVNQELIAQGRATAQTRPFTEGSTVYEIRISQDLVLARTYLKDPARLKDGAVGSWLMSAAGLRGLSRVQVKDLFALPALNDYLTTVKIPAGTVIRTGSAGPIDGWGDGGGQQILLMTRLPIENYAYQRTLTDQILLFSSVVPDGNAGAAAAYLDHLPVAAPYGDWSLVNLLLGYLPPGQLASTLVQIGPERYDTLTQLDLQNALYFTEALTTRGLNRLDSRRFNLPKSVSAGSAGQGQEPSGFEMDQGGFHYWGQGGGTLGRQDSTGDLQGFTFQSGSFLAGADCRAGEKGFLGAALGFSRTGFSWNDSLGDGNVTQINLGVYGTLLAPPFFLNGAVAVGVRKAEVTRRIVFPGVDRLGTSSPAGYNGAARFEGGLHRAVGDWNLQPIARMTLIATTQGAFNESGADSLNLQVEGIQSQTWRGELGFRLYRVPAGSSGWKIVPDLWLGWGYQAPIDNRELKASLSGQPGSFVVNGYKDPEGGFLPSLGIEALGPGKVSLSLRYEGDFRPDYTSQSLRADIRIPF
jgi:outer membrane autotransporter protein